MHLASYFAVSVAAKIVITSRTLWSCTNHRRERFCIPLSLAISDTLFETSYTVGSAASSSRIPYTFQTAPSTRSNVRHKDHLRNTLQKSNNEEIFLCFFICFQFMCSTALDLLCTFIMLSPLSYPSLISPRLIWLHSSRLF